ncbi:MAG: periplasmic heavy metal sensor [Pseudotabrizicola sp.]|uniref:periplasmic heavy metal sensor n=1 Tax=Pseudotabrizicola sp. TaxID=2939647 RepID=UPI002731D43D|nr:periplasmic heavy metal sensor [Pseudotabrizicola sp.]MDP2080469.1 periplasmic heavy metal sensor [Pseudotabrizicola sp.]MDZ7573686.1 periplasmic heavy metal sensor [Pseudotabrizicola sp.]
MTEPPPISPAKSTGKSTGRGVKILLAVSLALNLAVAGTVAGMALRWQDAGRSAPSAVRDLNFGPFTEALTRDQRRAMLRGFVENGPGLREMRAQMRGDFDAVLAALRASPFDPVAFQAAVETQSRRMASRAEGGRDALVTLVVQMSETERAVFVERLEKSLARGGKRPGRGDEQPRN